jgi:hypothetical protein
MAVARSVAGRLAEGPRGRGYPSALGVMRRGIHVYLGTIRTLYAWLYDYVS